MVMATLNNRLRELRQGQGMTQMCLAQKARLTPQIISSIERGFVIPYPCQKRRIARALGVPIWEVFLND